jgi:competence protein ComEA
MQTTRRTIALLGLALTLLTSLPAAAAEAGVVNINTAGEAQLTLLPRVGPALAQRILDFRKENGKFEATEDLMLVRGVGEKVFETLEPYVSLDGQTTLKEKVKSPSRAKQ